MCSRVICVYVCESLRSRACGCVDLKSFVLSVELLPRKFHYFFEVEESLSDRTFHGFIVRKWPRRKAELFVEWIATEEFGRKLCPNWMHARSDDSRSIFFFMSCSCIYSYTFAEFWQVVCACVQVKWMNTKRSTGNDQCRYRFTDSKPKKISTFCFRMQSRAPVRQVCQSERKTRAEENLPELDSANHFCHEVRLNQSLTFSVHISFVLLRRLPWRCVSVIAAVQSRSLCISMRWSEE